MVNQLSSEQLSPIPKGNGMVTFPHFDGQLGKEIGEANVMIVSEDMMDIIVNGGNVVGFMLYNGLIIMLG